LFAAYSIGRKNNEKERQSVRQGVVWEDNRTFEECVSSHYVLESNRLTAIHYEMKFSSGLTHIIKKFVCRNEDFVAKALLGAVDSLAGTGWADRIGLNYSCSPSIQLVWLEGYCSFLA